MDKYLVELTNLMNDSLSGKVALFSNEETTKYTDQAIREAFFEILGEDTLTEVEANRIIMAAREHWFADEK